MTRARNTIATTNTGPLLIEGIQGTSMAIHATGPGGDRGPQANLQKLSATKSDASDAKKGQQMTFGADSYQGQTH